jgi:molybdopterin synthase catalytic subunit
MAAAFELIDDANGDVVSLVSDVIDLSYINRARSTKAGAVSTFLGTTRDNFEGKEVTTLEYEAYPEMALTTMQDICTRIREQWDVICVVIQHKLGPCPIGDISVLIAVSSEHRRESLQAVQFAIDELKKSVPIWKKEKYACGDSLWKENAEAP